MSTVNFSDNNFDHIENSRWRAQSEKIVLKDMHMACLEVKDANKNTRPSTIDLCCGVGNPRCRVSHCTRLASLWDIGGDADNNQDEQNQVNVIITI